METAERKIKVLKNLIEKINSRRRRTDGSIPPETRAAGKDISAVLIPQEQEEEEIPYMPEEFEVKAEEALPAQEPERAESIIPLEKLAEEEVGRLEEEAEEGEVTDKVQVIPPLEKVEEAEAKTERIEEEITLDWFKEPPVAEEVKEKVKEPEMEAFDFPEVESIPPPPPEEKKAQAPEKAEPLLPELIEGKPPIEAARPVSSTGTPRETAPRTIGELLRLAYKTGE